jgi:hypothetical protein
MLYLLKVVAELLKLIRQHISVRQEIKRLAVLMLHLVDIHRKLVFPCELVALREVVNLLVLIESFVQVGLATAARPQQVPLV